MAALIDENLTMKVFEEASPSVVSIINYKFAGGVQVPEGIGTGVVWDSVGHIVTNYHVISKLDKGSLSQVGLPSVKT
jgi:S1-C subfamily serine protease